MSAMTAMPAVPPRGRPYTYEDLAAIPDDSHRYEIVDGLLIVSPSPRPVHQRAVGEVFVALREHCPAEYEAFVAPLDVKLADDTVLIPDVLVARRSDVGEKNLPAPPVLAVEVLSPSTRRVDLLLKHSRLAEAGTPHYWIVDPDEPSVLAWRLDGDAYVEVARASGDEVLDLAEPFPVRIVPSALVRAAGAGDADDAGADDAGDADPPADPGR